MVSVRLQNFLWASEAEVGIPVRLHDWPPSSCSPANCARAPPLAGPSHALARPCHHGPVPRRHQPSRTHARSSRARPRGLLCSSWPERPPARSLCGLRGPGLPRRPSWTAPWLEVPSPNTSSSSGCRGRSIPRYKMHLFTILPLMYNL
jgi:hypothetical protein